MKWLMALMLAVTVTFGGSAMALHPEPGRYEVGKVQSFIGLVCKTQAPATHIFLTWKTVGVVEARKVFQIYNGADECFSAQTFEAYFIEQLDSIEAMGFRGKRQTVLLFSISPSKESERTDYLITWVIALPKA